MWRSGGVGGGRWRSGTDYYPANNKIELKIKLIEINWNTNLDPHPSYGAIIASVELGHVNISREMLGNLVLG